jgi:hypothetical protein
MDEKENRFPSTAFNERGHPDADPATDGFVPCRINQPHYYAQGKGAHNMGPLKHPVKPGYCEPHKVLGCERCGNG